MKKDHVNAKAILAHESYHTIQNRAKKCRKYVDVNALRTIASRLTVMEESSAEHYAIQSLSEVERNYYINKYFITPRSITSKSFYDLNYNGSLDLKNADEEYNPIYLWSTFNSHLESPKLDYLDLIKFISERSSGKSLLIPEFITDEYITTLFKEYYEHKKIDPRGTFLSINSSLYFNNVSYRYMGTFQQYGEGPIDQFNFKSFFPVSSVNTLDFDPYKNIADDSSVQIKVNPFGGNFYLFNPTLTKYERLSRFPSLLTVKAKPTTCVLLGVDRTVSLDGGDSSELVRDGSQDGYYKFLIFRGISTLNVPGKNILLNLANPTGELDLVSVDKFVLCKTRTVSQSTYMKITCDEDCGIKRQVNYICTQDLAFCGIPSIYMTADKKTKYVNMGPSGKLVSCQLKVDPNKVYEKVEDLDFSVVEGYPASFSPEYLPYQSGYNPYYEEGDF